MILFGKNTMKYSPRYVIYLAIIKYLRKDQIACFNYELKHTKINESQEFLKVVDHYFDIDLFKNKPLIWQDIWLYYYLQKDFTSNFGKKGLVMQYEKEVILPKNIAFNEMYESYMILGLG
jgi:hypothetical protein